MWKSGLIVGVVALLFGFAATFVSPLCAPCVALFAGLGAGYLAGWFDRPGDQGSATKSGAAGGAIAGFGGLAGNMIAAVVNIVVVGPARAAQIAHQFGLPGDASGAAFVNSYYVSSLIMPLCIALFNIALMAGLGALGGMLWFQVSGKKSAGA
jgi:hypothetical protein